MCNESSNLEGFAPSKNHWSHLFQIALMNLQLHMMKLTVNLGGFGYIVRKESPFLKSEPEETGTHYNMRKVVCYIETKKVLSKKCC